MNGHPDLNFYGREIPVYQRYRLGVTSFTNAEYLSMLGVEYTLEFDVTLAAGQSKWIRFVAPPNRDVNILDRKLSTTVAGGEYNIYFTASAFTDDATNQVKIQTMNPMPGIAPLSTIKSQAVAPTVTGTFFTPILAGYNSSNNPSTRPIGTQSPNTGLKVYERNTGFYGRLYNPTTVSNRMLLQITFAEIDNTLIP